MVDVMIGVGGDEAENVLTGIFSGTTERVGARVMIGVRVGIRRSGAEVASGVEVGWGVRAPLLMICEVNIHVTIIPAPSMTKSRPNHKTNCLRLTNSTGIIHSHHQKAARQDHQEVKN